MNVELRRFLVETLSIDTIKEGGNVFAGKTASIQLANIEPTLNRYFDELKAIFPRKKEIFSKKNFVPLGSVGKKPLSGDIDLGVDSKILLDHEMSDKSITEWGIDIDELNDEYNSLAKRARTSTPPQIRMKAFLKLLSLYINKNAKNLYCDEKKITDGNIFGLFPQYDVDGKKLELGVQIDWMVGDLEWLTFSYYSAAYPKGSNVKGLHRTQLMLAAFQVGDMSFNHVSGVKNKESGEIIAKNPDKALEVLGDKLGFKITREDAEDYYKLHKLLKGKMRKADYETLLRVYFKILDSTRADIPDDMQKDWLRLKSEIGLTGKFLPTDSKLNNNIKESGSAGADRVKTRADYKKFLDSYIGHLKGFSGFVSADPSGSYNSDPSKNSFGDIDLVVHIDTTDDKPSTKKKLAAYLESLHSTVIMPFASDKYKGKRHLNTGEIITVRYQDKSLGYSAQIDNIIAISHDEKKFKLSFLDLPAEKQGLVMGLVKIAGQQDDVQTIFKKLGIKVPMELGPDEEYEFNISSIALSLRRTMYKPGTRETISSEVVWSSKDFAKVQSLLYRYDLTKSFEDLLSQIKKHVTDERSRKRVGGVFSSMVSVKSGEAGTPKGDNKVKALAAVATSLG